MCPTKSGVIVERRDHVLKIFFRSCGSSPQFDPSDANQQTDLFLVIVPFLTLKIRQVYYFSYDAYFLFLRLRINLFDGLLTFLVFNPLALCPQGLHG